MTTTRTALTMMAGAIAALSFTTPTPATAQTAGQTDWSVLGPCQRAGTKFDVACVQRAVLQKGFADRTGRACYILDSPASPGLVARWELSNKFQSFDGRGCAAGRTTYDAALSECAARGVGSCRKLAAGGGNAVGGVTASGPLNQILGGVLAPSQNGQGGSPSIGGVLGTVEDAAGAINSLKGLFQ